MTSQTSRRSFLARVIAAGSAITSALWSRPPAHAPENPTTEEETLGLRLVTDESGVEITPSSQAEELTRTMPPGVYLVGDDIPGLDVESGDHIIVRDTHAALHRYLDHEMLVILKDHGDLTWVKGLAPSQTVWRPDGCYKMVGPFVSRVPRTKTGAIRTVTDRSILRLVR